MISKTKASLPVGSSLEIKSEKKKIQENFNEKNNVGMRTQSFKGFNFS